MNKQDKAKRILQVLKGDKVDFSAFDTSVADLRASLVEKITIPTIDKVDSELEKFKKKLDLQPLLTSLEEVKKNVDTKITELTNQLDTKLAEHEANETDTHTELDKTFSAEINGIRAQIAGLDMIGSGELAKVEKEIKDLATKTEKDIKAIPDREKEIKEINDELEKFRIDFLNRLSQIGGGSMNRKVTFGGTDYLTKYTDINWKAGTNVTFTVANNDTTKQVDITIAATGGGGGGITRSINSISTDTTAGDTAATDYVYLVSGTTTLTLPTAVGNTNLYTIKNVGVGVVTVATTSSETIDGALTQVMPVQFTSIDVESDTAGWNIT